MHVVDSGVAHLGVLGGGENLRRRRVLRLVHHRDVLLGLRIELVLECRVSRRLGANDGRRQWSDGFVLVLRRRQGPELPLRVLLHEQGLRGDHLHWHHRDPSDRVRGSLRALGLVRRHLRRLVLVQHVLLIWRRGLHCVVAGWVRLGRLAVLQVLVDYRCLLVCVPSLVLDVWPLVHLPVRQSLSLIVVRLIVNLHYINIIIRRLGPRRLVRRARLPPRLALQLRWPLRRTLLARLLPLFLLLRVELIDDGLLEIVLVQPDELVLVLWPLV